MTVAQKMHFMRALRISLAMLISFIYIRTVYVSDGIWIIMTCAIILFDNSTVGGALIKCYYRIIGTVIAAIFSIFVVIAFANSTIANLIAIIISVFVAGYYFMDTKKSYVGGLVSWTTPIMLINNHNLSSIFIRPLNIIIGIIISYIVQRFFFPEYAQNLVLTPFVDLISKTRLLFNNAVNINSNKYSPQTRETIEINVISNINKAVKLIDETKSELAKLPEYAIVCNDIIMHLRRLMKYIAVFTYQIEDRVINLTDELELAVKNFDGILKILEETLINSIEGSNNLSNLGMIKINLQKIEDDVFIKCTPDQLPILKMLRKELLEIDQLMLKLVGIRKSYNMY